MPEGAWSLFVFLILEVLFLLDVLISQTKFIYSKPTQL